MARLFRLAYHYDRCFRTHPAATLAIANAVCSILGDAAAQLITIYNADPGQISGFSYARLLRYFLYGLNMGPVGGKWNEILDRRFSPRARRRPSSAELEKSTELVEINTTTSTEPPVKKRLDETGEPARLDLLTILKMVLADQLIMAPSSLLFFLCFMGLTEGNTWVVVRSRIDRLFFKLLLANWQVWPIIQLINFKFMPLRLRVPFGAACGILWTIFLSYAST